MLAESQKTIRGAQAQRTLFELNKVMTGKDFKDPYGSQQTLRELNQLYKACNQDHLPIVE